MYALLCKEKKWKPSQDGASLEPTHTVTLVALIGPSMVLRSPEQKYYCAVALLHV